jgi:hypothetical protein
MPKDCTGNTFNDLDIARTKTAVEFRDSLQDIIPLLSKTDLDQIRRSTLQVTPKEKNVEIAESFNKMQKTSNKKFWISSFLQIVQVVPQVEQIIRDILQKING